VGTASVNSTDAVELSRAICPYTPRVEPGCPFCKYVAGSFERELISYEDDVTLVVPSLHQRPRNRGHMVVATRAHVETLFALDDPEAASLLLVVRSTAIAAKQAFRADGISVRQNNGAAAGQDVFHVHVHVIPRYKEDTFETDAYAEVPEDVRVHQARTLYTCWPTSGL
jgi:histidine triad (HIT) family protein